MSKSLFVRKIFRKNCNPRRGTKRFAKLGSAALRAYGSKAFLFRKKRIPCLRLRHKRKRGAKANAAQNAQSILRKPLLRNADTAQNPVFQVCFAAVWID